MTPIRIESLHIYPVKSLRGIELSEAAVTTSGLNGDRRFMLIRPDGRFVTQREFHSLALIETAVSSEELILSRPGHGSVAVSLEAGDGPVIQSKVWRDECEVVDCGDEAAEWLTAATEAGTALRLVRMAPGSERQYRKPDRFGPDNKALFADAAPYLVANQASLQQLNHELLARGIDAVPMNRFRPNIVISGPEAFAEHGLSLLSNEQLGLRLHDACERCIVTTINQETGQRDGANQPFSTLRDINAMPGNPRAPAFGQNASLAFGEQSLIRVGDSFTIGER